MTFREKVNIITLELRKRIEQKYTITEMKLFGSSARGDFSKTSDIDIMVRMPKVNREIEEDLFNITYELELEFDCIIDIIVLPEDIQTSIPLYLTIEKEGVTI